MPGTYFKFEPYQSNLAALVNRNKIVVKKHPLPGVKVGNDNKRMKHQGLEIFEANNAQEGAPSLGCIGYHGASGADRQTERDQETDHLVRFIEEFLNKFVVLPWDVNEPFFKLKEGIAEPESIDDFEVDKQKIKTKVKKLIGTKFLLVSIQTPEMVVEKGRIPADMDQNSQTTKPLAGETEYDSKAGRVVLMPRPNNVTQAEAEAMADALVDTMVIPENGELCTFGIDFTYGTDHGKIKSQAINAAQEKFIHSAKIILGYRFLVLQKSFNDTLGTLAHITTSLYALIGTAGMAGFRDKSKVFKRVPLTRDDKILLHRRALAFQDIFTKVLSEDPSLVANHSDKLATLQPLLVDNKGSTNFIRFATLIQEKFWNDYLLNLNGDGDQGRKLVQKALLAWIDSPPYKDADDLLIRPELKAEDVSTLVASMVKHVANTSAEALNTQCGAGYDVDINPRNDQLWSLIQDEADFCLMTDSKHGTNAASFIKDPRFKGHLFLYSDMRKVAELKNLKSYLDALPEEDQFEIDYVRIEDRATFDLDRRLAELRLMVFKCEMKGIFDVFTTPQAAFAYIGSNFQEVLNIVQKARHPDNAPIACALFMNLPFVKDKVYEIIDSKLLQELNNAELDIIAGYLADHPEGDEEGEKMQDYLLAKMIEEGTDPTSLNIIFDTIPELAIRCAQIYLENHQSELIIPIEIFMHPAVLMNASEQLTIAFNLKQSCVKEQTKLAKEIEKKGEERAELLGTGIDQLDQVFFDIPAEIEALQQGIKGLDAQIEIHQALLDKQAQTVKSIPMLQKQLDLEIGDMEKETGAWLKPILAQAKQEEKGEFKTETDVSSLEKKMASLEVKDTQPENSGNAARDALLAKLTATLDSDDDNSDPTVKMHVSDADPAEIGREAPALSPQREQYVAQANQPEVSASNEPLEELAAATRPKLTRRTESLSSS